MYNTQHRPWYILYILHILLIWHKKQRIATPDIHTEKLRNRNPNRTVLPSQHDFINTQSKAWSIAAVVNLVSHNTLYTLIRCQTGGKKWWVMTHPRWLAQQLSHSSRLSHKRHNRAKTAGHRPIHMSHRCTNVPGHVKNLTGRSIHE